MKTKNARLLFSRLGQGIIMSLGLLIFTGGQVSADDATWDMPPDTVTTTDDLTGVAYSGKLYVAVGGTSGTPFIATSKNARAWTQRSTSVTVKLNDVAWSGTLFAAVGEEGKIITSPDGVTWTTRTSGVTATLNAVIWAGNQFVAVGDATILTSANGTMWAKKTVPPDTTAPVDFPYDRNFLDVAWTGTKLVVLSAGDVTISTSGAVWTRQVVNNEPVVGGSSIAWNGKVLCKVPQTGSATVETSLDGVQWTVTDVSDVLVGTFLNAVGVVAGTFYAVGTDGCVISSPDGVTWTAETTPGFGNLLAVGGALPTLMAVGGEGTVFGRGDLGTDGPIVAGFTETDVSIDEGAGNLLLTVRLSDVAPGPASFTIPYVIKYQSPASSKDIKAPTTALQFKEGMRQLQLAIPITPDALDEDDESFTVTLSSGTGYSLDDSTKVCNVTIVDDDTTPMILMLSDSQIVPSGESPELSVLADGSAPLTVQWRKNKTAVKGALGDTYALNNITVAQGGAYDAQAKNPVNPTGVLSDKIELAVVDSVDKYPTLVPGGVATLTANVGASPNTVTFQWQKNGDDVQNDTGAMPRITGAKSSVLKIKNVTTTDSDDYVCIVTQTSTGLNVPTGAQHLSVVTAKPALQPITLPSGQVLRPYNYQVGFETERFRAPGKFTATGLPPGLTINADTGVISGIPTAALANKPITVTATNAKGSHSVSGNLTILALPGIGTYQGLVARSPTAPWAGADLGARIQIDTTAAGSYTGKLINASTLPFKGQLAFDDNDNLVSTTTVPPLSPGGPTLTLTLTIDVTTDTMTGELSLDGEITTVNAWRNVWSATNPATGYAGQFNFILTNTSGDGLMTPGGDGYGSFKVVATGASFDIKGKLPDGTGLTCNTFVGPQGQVLLYQTQYTTAGSILGQLEIVLPTEELPFVTLAQSESATWNKPPQSTATDKTYRTGFELMNLDVIGGPYQAPASGQVVMGMSEVDLNAMITFAGAGVESSETPADVPFTIAPAPSSAATMLTGDENPAKVTFKVTASTGEFSGTFTLKDTDPINDGKFFTRNAKFNGLIVMTDAGPFASGMFTMPQIPDPFATPEVTALNAQTLAGRVTLMPNPGAPAPITVQFAEAETSFGEGDDTVTLSVNLSEPFAKSRTIPFSVIHGTTSAADVSVTGSSVTFPAGETEASITLKITQDHLDEEDETFTIQLADGIGYDVGSPGSCVVTILDDDSKPVFDLSPLPQIVATGDPVTLDSTASGDDPITYQWRRNAITLGSQTAAGLILESVTLNDAGVYDVVATNPSGVTYSEKADLAVVDNTEHPLAVASGNTATFTANYAATANSLTFQWQKSGVDLTDDSGADPRISGAATGQLVIKNVSATDADDYTCTITQTASGGTAITGIFHLYIINGKPVLDPFTPQDGKVAEVFTYQVSFDPDPDKRPASFSATGLPSGLSINTITGLISGTPTAAVANQSVTIKAFNSFEPGGVSVTGTLTILPLDSGLLGSFQGYVDRAPVTYTGDDPPVRQVPWPRADLGARIQLTTTASGSYSGQLINGGTTLNFTGQMLSDGGIVSSSTTVPITGQAPLPLTLNFDVSANTVSGTLGSDENMVVVSAWRNVWPGGIGVPVAGYMGLFNFAMQNADGPSDAVPAGFGFGSFKVPASGNFDIAGKLPDGTDYTCNSFLGPNGEILIFAPLYTQPGSLLGKLMVTPGDDITPASVASDMVTWMKPPQASTTDRNYRLGFDPQTLTVSGGIYTPPALGDIIFGLPDQADNASLTFADGGLLNSETFADTIFRIKVGGSATIPAPGDGQATVTFSLKPSTGEYSGTFILTDHNPDTSAAISRTATFSGLVTQNVYGGLSPGFFSLKQLADPYADPPTTLLNSPILTGSVLLNGN